MEAFVGTWKLESSENFDDLMKVYGVSLVTRNLANAATPVLTVTKEEDGSYLFESSTTFKTTKFQFKDGEEFNEVCPDGPTVKAIVNLDGNRMVHDQHAEGTRPATKIIRTVENGKMTMVLETENVKCTRVYSRQ